MPEDFNIPTNKIASSGMVNIGTPTITLQGLGQDPNAQLWGGLSKSLQGLGEVFTNM